MRITISGVPAVGVDTAFVFREVGVGAGFNRFYPLEVVNNYEEDLVLSLEKIEVLDNDFLLEVATLSFAKDGVDFLILPPGMEGELSENLICVGAGETNTQLTTGVSIDKNATNFYQGKSFAVKYYLGITGVAECPQVEGEEAILGRAGAMIGFTNDDLSVTMERMNEEIPRVALATGGELAAEAVGSCCCRDWSFLWWGSLFFTLLNFVLLLGLYKRGKRKNGGEKN